VRPGVIAGAGAKRLRSVRWQNAIVPFAQSESKLSDADKRVVIKHKVRQRDQMDARKGEDLSRTRQ
jgi:hypothetical protein